MMQRRLTESQHESQTLPRTKRELTKIGYTIHEADEGVDPRRERKPGSEGGDSPAVRPHERREGIGRTGGVPHLPDHAVGHSAYVMEDE